MLATSGHQSTLSELIVVVEIILLANCWQSRFEQLITEVASYVINVWLQTMKISRLM